MISAEKNTQHSRQDRQSKGATRIQCWGRFPGRNLGDGGLGSGVKEKRDRHFGNNGLNDGENFHGTGHGGGNHDGDGFGSQGRHQNASGSRHTTSSSAPAATVSNTHSLSSPISSVSAAPTGPQTEQASPTLSVDVSSIGIQSIRSSTATTTPVASPITATTVPIASPIPRNALPAGAIAGIVIGILYLLSLAIGLCIWRRRRRQHVLAHPGLAASPFILLPSGTTTPIPSRRIVADNSDARTIRQEFLENELRAAQEKMVDVEDLERDTSVGETGTRDSRPRRIMHFRSLRSTGATGSRASEDLVSELEAARTRNEAQEARIRELEAHMSSEVDLGLSAEPPPKYMA
ncbi:hypothetical protein FB451DRAFT_1189043 [Mycena latifolia]|nr:hypothetical protein FB451DRAFT_1189043 [Mycena latifolia]